MRFMLAPACASTDLAAARQDARARDRLDHLLSGARPEVDEIERAVARARTESALFGEGSGPPRIGRYCVVERAGAGGMGVVWAAYDPELHRAVAIKVVRAASAAARDRVLAEGQALARLSHPNVIPVFDVGLYADQVFLVLELVRGETLREHVAAAPRDPRAIAQIYRQAGEGLAAAHRAGLVHRDFKPDNAIVGRDGRVRVLDFGLACPSGLTDDAPDVPPVIGTPRYMAPEQAAGGAITAAADQYAFCLSLREALTPRAGDATRATPRWLEAIVARGTHADPAARFPSMDEVTRALARDPRVVRRNRLLVVAAAALASGAFTVGRAASQGGDEMAACDGGRAAIAAVRGPRGRAALAASVDLFGAPGTVPGAMIARGELPDLGRCGDAAAMPAAVAPPPVAVATQAAAVESDLDRALALLRADLDEATMSTQVRRKVSIGSSSPIQKVSDWLRSSMTSPRGSRGSTCP